MSEEKIWTAEEVLAFVKESGWATDGLLRQFRMPDDSVWTVSDKYAVCMWEAPRLARLKVPIWNGEVDALAKRGKVRVSVADQARYDQGPFDFGASYENGSLNRVIKSLERMREIIPEKYRAKARCGIDSESGYEGSHSPRIEVSYERLETNEEWDARKKDVAERLEYQKAQKREQLERLKIELGEPA